MWGLMSSDDGLTYHKYTAGNLPTSIHSLTSSAVRNTAHVNVHPTGTSLKRAFVSVFDCERASGKLAVKQIAPPTSPYLSLIHI